MFAHKVSGKRTTSATILVSQPWTDIYPSVSVSWQRLFGVTVVVPVVLLLASVRQRDRRWDTIGQRWHFNFVFNSKTTGPKQGIYVCACIKYKRIPDINRRGPESVTEREREKAHCPSINVEKVKRSVLRDYLRVSKDVASLWPKPALPLSLPLCLPVSVFISYIQR